MENLDQKHKILGEKRQESVSLGIGVQSFTNMKNCTLHSALSAVESVSEERPLIYGSAKITYTLEEMRSSLDVAISAAGTTPIPLEIEGGVKAHFEKTHKQSHSYAVITINKRTKISRVSNPAINQEAVALLNADRSEDFFAQYGNKFVGEVTYGNKIFAVLQIDTEDTSKVQEINALLKAKFQSAEGGLDVKRVLQELGSIKSVNKVVMSIGDNSSWSFDTSSELEEAVSAHLDKNTSAVIEYDYFPYTSVEGLTSENIERVKYLDFIVERRNDRLLSRVEGMLEKIQNLKILSGSIVDENKYEAKDADPLYQEYAKLKEEAESQAKALQELKKGICECKRFLTVEEEKQKDEQLVKIEQWHHANKENIKRVTSRTLIRQIRLEEGKEKTKAFILKFSPEMRHATKYLYIEFSEPGVQTFKIKSRGCIKVGDKKYSFIGPFRRPTEQKALPASGCYFDAALGNLCLGIKLVNPQALNKEIFVHVYAVSEKTNMNGFKSVATLNEKNSRLPPLDGAVGDDYRGETDSSVRTYLEYSTSETSLAELSQKVGAVVMTASAEDEFELETTEDFEYEVRAIKGKAVEGFGL